MVDNVTMLHFRKMALPTMQPYYKQKRCAVPDHNYYVKVANDTAKQRQWNSARCMERRYQITLSEDNLYACVVRTISHYIVII